jgi:ribosome-associated translation inhibitor RaiA
MIIQINSDNNITVHPKFEAELDELLTTKLSRFVDHITRIEVHFSDENGQKGGGNDKKCKLEARMEGRQPIVVTDINDTLGQSASGAIEKMKAALTTVVEKARNH